MHPPSQGRLGRRAGEIGEGWGAGYRVGQPPHPHHTPRGRKPPGDPSCLLSTRAPNTRACAGGGRRSSAHQGLGPQDPATALPCIRGLGAPTPRMRRLVKSPPGGPFPPLSPVSLVWIPRNKRVTETSGKAVQAEVLHGCVPHWRGPGPPLLPREWGPVRPQSLCQAAPSRADGPTITAWPLVPALASGSCFSGAGPLIPPSGGFHAGVSSSVTAASLCHPAGPSQFNWGGPPTPLGECLLCPLPSYPQGEGQREDKASVPKLAPDTHAIWRGDFVLPPHASWTEWGWAASGGKHSPSWKV